MVSIGCGAYGFILGAWQSANCFGKKKDLIVGLGATAVIQARPSFMMIVLPAFVVVNFKAFNDLSSGSMCLDFPEEWGLFYALFIRHVKAIACHLYIIVKLAKNGSY